MLRLFRSLFLRRNRESVFRVTYTHDMGYIIADCLAPDCNNVYLSAVIDWSGAWLAVFFARAGKNSETRLLPEPRVIPKLAVQNR